MTKFGKLVILTGVNGAGKGTIGPFAAWTLSRETKETWSYLYGPKANGYTTAVRSLVLDPDPDKRPSDPLADALLWFSQHAESAKVIEERRASGENLIVDRGPETTRVYNVDGRNLQLSYPFLGWLYRSLLKKFNPDLGIVLDVTAEESLRRSKKQSETDHYQLQEIEEHEKRRQLFAELSREPGWVLVDAMPSVEEVVEAVLQEVRKVTNSPIEK